MIVAIAVATASAPREPVFKQTPGPAIHRDDPTGQLRALLEAVAARVAVFRESHVERDPGVTHDGPPSLSIGGQVKPTRATPNSFLTRVLSG